MSRALLSEFADKVIEVMPVIMKEFLKQQTADFYKTKITLPQFAVIEALRMRGECKMTELARLINVTTAATTGIIDRLVKAGYVVRESDPKDRRVVDVKVTAKGIKIVDRAKEDRRQMIMKIFGVVSRSEREQYLGILMHIKEHLTKK